MVCVVSAVLKTNRQCIVQTVQLIKLAYLFRMNMKPIKRKTVCTRQMKTNAHTYTHTRQASDDDDNPN